MTEPTRIAPLSLLTEMTFPEYRNRHLFTARLRLAIFVVFFCAYFFYFHTVIPPSDPAVQIIALASLLTLLAYYQILNGRRMIFSFLLEIAADLAGITTCVSALGGVESEYFLLYCGYCLTAGLFYNYRVTAAVSVACLASYGALYFLTTAGVVAWHHHGLAGDHAVVDHGVWQHPLWLHPLLLALLLLFCTYAVRIAQNFSFMRERALEARNRELIALQRIASTIRAAALLPEVADRIITGLVEGLDFSLCLLLLVDHRREQLVCYPPLRTETSLEAERLLGVPLRELALPLATDDNIVLRQIKERKIVFRRSLADLFRGMRPTIATERLQQLQQRLGIRKAVIIPLVSEGELLGALVGCSPESFVGNQAVATLETFANQAALVLQVTLLIDQLKTTNRELLEANRVKSEFLATMSHELRTPLTAIIGFSELLVEGAFGPVGEEQRDSLREILNNGANLLELINNILDLSKAESGRLKLHVSAFDLRELLERTHRTLGSLIARKALHCTLDVATNLPTLIGDERRLQQVILNLLGNAIKFTPEAGRIQIQARAFSALENLLELDWVPHVGNRLALQHGGVYLSVRDTGIGIPATHLHTIFEMFKQVDSSVTRKYEGTGLGLALVRQLGDMHQGAIWAESSEGRGTIFHCLLPLTQPDEDESSPQRNALAAPPIRFSSIRVPV